MFYFLNSCSDFSTSCIAHYPFRKKLGKLLVSRSQKRGFVKILIFTSESGYFSQAKFWRRSALGFLWREWCWSWNSSTLATSCEELTHWKRPWCWEGLGAGGEGDDRGWDGWMASLTQWTWVWVNSGSWWWAGRPDMLRIMGSQRVGHELSDWTELNWNSLYSTAWKMAITEGFHSGRDMRDGKKKKILEALPGGSSVSLPLYLFHAPCARKMTSVECITPALLPFSLIGFKPWEGLTGD